MTCRTIPYAALAGCLSLAHLAACSCEGELTREAGTHAPVGDDGAVTTTIPGTGGGVDESESGAETATTTAGEACPMERTCQGGTCCEVGELCQAGRCVPDCGGEPACGEGDALACCAGEEVCHAGACVMPGMPCGAGACATQPDQGACGSDEFCEPVLGRCLPKEQVGECVFVPPPSVFEPVPLFTWGERAVKSCANDSECQSAEVCDAGTCAVTWPHVDPEATDKPDFVQVTSVPLVVDLDADCVPEVVFNSYDVWGNNPMAATGVLRAIRGDNGAKVWTADIPEGTTDTTANPAAGDLDGDGDIEIVVPASAMHLIGVDHQGGFLWRSDDYAPNALSGSPAIANLDGEGDAEIVFGYSVFDSMGTLLFEGADGRGNGHATNPSGGIGPISCVADLDSDGRPDVVAGNTAYTFTGTVAGGDFAGGTLWQGTETDGYCGVADFTGDGAPEVVLVSGGSIHVLSGQSGATLASLALPGGGFGGAPNIADFDGDGRADIGTAGGSNYVVATFDGVDTLSILWQAATRDSSSNRTGSSVFDFDGDGRAEVVYNDELFVRIYPGVEPDCQTMPQGPLCDGVMTDEEVLFIDRNGSRTRTEYPVVADVNGDFKAELIFVTNNEATGILMDDALDAGVEVWKDALDNWVSTRPVWNQHSYHITNVGVDGSVPAVEASNWSTPAASPYNSYRVNAQGDNEFCAPDLIPRALEYDLAECPEQLELSVWVVNQGCLGVGAGVDVTFYEATHGVLGTVQTTGPLVAGAAERVTLSLPAPGLAPFFVHVAVDDDGTGAGQLNECDEANNVGEPTEVCPVAG